MCLPTVCPRCGTEGCPAPVFDVRGLQGVYADIACSLRLMARIQEVTQMQNRDLIGLCPHGNLFCSYCWRDAGFPHGGVR